MYQVYLTENKANNKYYIGVHKGNVHLDNYYGSGKLIKRAIDKYGDKDFNQTIIAEFKNRDLALYTEKLLSGADVVDDENSYCIVQGGWGYVSGKDHPMFGKKRPKRNEQWCQRLSKANSGENAHFYGKKRPEHSKWMKGDNNPMKDPSVSKQFKGSGNPMYGVPSPWKDKKRPEHAKKMSKAIIQLDLDGNKIKEWNSIKEAAEHFSISSPSIIGCLKGKTKTSAGYKWKYKQTNAGNS